MSIIGDVLFWGAAFAGAWVLNAGKPASKKHRGGAHHHHAYHGHSAHLNAQATGLSLGAPQLLITYTDFAGEISERTIQPYLACYGATGHAQQIDRIDARCLTSHGEKRTFVLSRIKSAALAETGEVIAHRDLRAWVMEHRV